MDKEDLIKFWNISIHIWEFIIILQHYKIGHCTAVCGSYLWEKRKTHWILEVIRICIPDQICSASATWSLHYSAWPSLQGRQMSTSKGWGEQAYHALQYSHVYGLVSMWLMATENGDRCCRMDPCSLWQERNTFSMPTYLENPDKSWNLKRVRAMSRY